LSLFAFGCGLGLSAFTFGGLALVLRTSTTFDMVISFLLVDAGAGAGFPP
jgi:hypothetical protein